VGPGRHRAGQRRGRALAGAGLTVTLGLILAPRSAEEAWATLREGGGRFSTWLSRTFAPRAPGEEGK